MDIGSSIGGLGACYQARSYHRADIHVMGMTELKVLSEANVEDATKLCHERGIVYSLPTANMRTWVKYAPDGTLLTYMVCTVINLVSPGASIAQSPFPRHLSLLLSRGDVSSQAASALRSNPSQVAILIIRREWPSSRSSTRSAAVVAKPSSLRNPLRARKHRRSGRGV